MFNSGAALRQKHGPSGDGVPKYAFLGDLGKPTLRGVRKCDKCGTLNGTRGIRCKNSKCDQIFKTAEKKKPCGPEAVKLLTDPSIQIYSVRSRTGDNRGFVQLPIVQDLEGNPAVVDVGIVCSAAKCYVETCARSRNDALEPCFHIQSSVEALEEATPLTFKNSVLNSMAVTPEMRQVIWRYATEKPGPLVQRVSKNIMAVKTAVTMRNPLGYLHFSFQSNKKDEKRFQCTCREAKIAKVTMTESDTGGECTYRIQRCVHFYACVCAFASDEALSKEFKYAIDADKEFKYDKDETMMMASSAIEDVVLTCGKSLEEVESSAAVESVVEETAATEGGLLEGEDDSPSEVIISAASTSLDYDYRSVPAGKLTLSTAALSSEPKRFKCNPVMIQPHTPSSLRKGQTYITFLQWLQSVTEAINLTMHYSLPGNPKPLVFHIPQVFWDCLMDRISNCSLNKRLLPNHTCTVIRSQIPPIGSYTQFSWYLTELAHVRKVFDTAEVALLVSKYYDRAEDGTFTLSTTPRVQVDTSGTGVKTSRPAPPTGNTHEYKTFLRVGLQGLVPFIIDWTPDLYPITHTGELSITFQYSHMIDGLSPAVDTDMVQHVIEGTTRYHHNIIIDV